MKNKKQNKSFLLRLLILGACVFVIATLVDLWSTLNKSRADLSALKEQYSAEQNDIDELKVLLEDGSQSKVIEKAARERLGFVYPDEQVFIDISGN